MTVVCHPLTPARWNGREAIFNAKGCSVARELLACAVAYARKRGVRLLEAYPVDKAEPTAGASSWFGSKAMFDAAGFDEVARRKPSRPIVRLRLEPS